MSALKSIPYAGELLVPGHPGQLQMVMVRVGSDTTDTTLDGNIGDTSWQDSDGDFPLFDIPSGIYVKDVLVQVEERFSDAIEVIIGDCDATDGYFTDTLLDPSTATTAVPKSTSGSANTYRYGKLYTSTDCIQMSLSGAWTAGQLAIFVVYALNISADAPSP